MSDEAANRVRERGIMLIIWTLAVASTFWIGAGFAGGFALALEDNALGWAFVLSPLIPLALWLKAWRDNRPGL